MDKILFVIKPHSVIDVITNSSTELFIINTTKTIEIIKEILQDLIDIDNKISGNSRTFEDIFDEPYIQNTDSVVDGWDIDIPSGSIVIYGAADNSIPFWMQEFLETNFGDNCRHHLG